MLIVMSLIDSDGKDCGKFTGRYLILRSPFRAACMLPVASEEHECPYLRFPDVVVAPLGESLHHTLHLVRHGRGNGNYDERLRTIEVFR